MSPRLASAMTSRPRSRASPITSRSAVQPARAEPLEAGHLGLDGHALVAGRLEQQPAMGGHRPRGPLGDARLLAPPARAVSDGQGIGPQPLRVGVEPEHDLRSALADRVGQAIAEGRHARGVGGAEPIPRRDRAGGLTPLGMARGQTRP